LKTGNNADLNGLVRGDRRHDEIPLQWRDQWIARFGVEYALADEWKIRAGYSWASSIVPQETLTPLTALLPEHTVNAGLGWKRGPWTVDLGWEWQLPRREAVNRTDLSTDQYLGSSTKVGVQWIGLTTTYQW
jgi:long-subunit fatty acid transport protein